MIVVMMEPATKNSTQQFCRINMYTIRSFAICSIAEVTEGVEVYSVSLRQNVSVWGYF